jgi:hypothetical protein
MNFTMRHTNYSTLDEPFKKRYEESQQTVKRYQMTLPSIGDTVYGKVTYTLESYDELFDFKCSE